MLRKLGGEVPWIFVLTPTVVLKDSDRKNVYDFHKSFYFGALSETVFLCDLPDVSAYILHRYFILSLSFVRFLLQTFVSTGAPQSLLT